MTAPTRGHLIAPSQRAGRSGTHCDVVTITGYRYRCRSAGPMADAERHRGSRGGVVACQYCRPVK